MALKHFELLLLLILVPVCFIIVSSFIQDIPYSRNAFKQIGLTKLNCEDIYASSFDYDNIEESKIECSENPLSIKYSDLSNCNVSRYKIKYDCNIKGNFLFVETCSNETIVNMESKIEKYCSIFVEEL